MEKHNEMSFLDHLEILRWHLIRSIGMILVIGVLGFIFKDFIFDSIIFAPKRGDFPTYGFFCQLGQFMGIESDFCKKELPFILQNREMSGQFSMAIWTSIWVGFIVGFPYFIYEIWRFIAPALYDNERKIARNFIFATSFLFFLGILFGYFIITPLSINFFANYSISKEVINEIDINSYIGIVRSSVISCGLLFELPIVVYFLTKVGLITPSFLRTYRKHAVILVLFVAAVITPPDVISQIIVSIPILLLYEISIFISQWIFKKNN